MANVSFFGVVNGQCFFQVPLYNQASIVDFVNVGMPFEAHLGVLSTLMRPVGCALLQEFEAMSLSGYDLRKVDEFYYLRKQILLERNSFGDSLSTVSSVANPTSNVTSPLSPTSEASSSAFRSMSSANSDPLDDVKAVDPLASHVAGISPQQSDSRLSGK